MISTVITHYNRLGLLRFTLKTITKSIVTDLELACCIAHLGLNTIHPHTLYTVHQWYEKWRGSQGNKVLNSTLSYEIKTSEIVRANNTQVIV
jgi:hypothetical protein